MNSEIWKILSQCALWFQRAVHERGEKGEQIWPPGTIHDHAQNGKTAIYGSIEKKNFWVIDCALDGNSKLMFMMKSQ